MNHASLPAEFPTLQRSWNSNVMDLLEDIALYLVVQVIFLKKRKILFGFKYISFLTLKTVVSGLVHMEAALRHLYIYQFSVSIILVHRSNKTLLFIT